MVGALVQILEEIRWRYPSVRISCCSVDGSTLRVLACTQPVSMQPLPEPPVVGRPVRALVDTLSSRDELWCVSVRDDARLAGVGVEILGRDTVATVILPVRRAGEVAGLLRMDAIEAGGLPPRAVEAMRAGLPAAELAVELVHERSATREAKRQLEYQKAKVSALRGVLSSLLVGVRSKTTDLDDARRRDLDGLLGEGAQQLGALLSDLEDPSGEFQWRPS